MEIYIGFDFARADTQKLPSYLRRRHRRWPSDAVPCSTVGLVQSGIIFRSKLSFPGWHYPDRARPADGGSKFDQHAAGGAHCRIPHQLAWRRRSALQSRKARHVLRCFPNLAVFNGDGSRGKSRAGSDSCKGLYVIEVFPAIALASLDTRFFGRLRAPRYNPDRKKTFIWGIGSVWQKPLRENPTCLGARACGMVPHRRENRPARKADQDKSIPCSAC